LVLPSSDEGGMNLKNENDIATAKEEEESLQLKWWEMAKWQ
jgi:hypothetical protein